MGDFTGSKRFTSIMCSGVISYSYNTSKLIRAFAKMYVAIYRIDFYLPTWCSTHFIQGLQYVCAYRSRQRKATAHNEVNH